MMHNNRRNLQLPGNTWVLEGVPLPELVCSFQTPFYLYNGDLITRRYRSFYNFIHWPQLKVFYAMKANYNPAVLRLLEKENCRIDAVSPAEVLLALKTGYAPDRILFTANNITDAEMAYVQALKVRFNIGSLSRLEKYGKAYPGSSVCLRFNPGIKAGEHPFVQTGGIKSKFGILPDDCPKAVQIAKQYNLQIVGLHMHTGSGIEEDSKFCEAMENLLSIADRRNFPDLQCIDLGGGFKVPYREEEPAVDYQQFGRKITDIFAAFCRQYGKELELWVEPGKYLTAEAGLFIVQVNTLKNNRDRLIAGCNSGFNHLIRPVLYQAYHPVINLSHPGGEHKVYDICGNICEGGDLFASERMLPEIREGDYLAILNAGAYCYAMGSVYNLRPLPAEVMLYRGKYRLITRQSTPEALVDAILGGSLWED